jgi:hypothetical protein
MSNILNTELTDSDVPARHEVWKKILPFALTFNGYAHWGSFQKCREVAEQGTKLYRGRKGLSQSLTDLRTCLFFEARRFKHFEKDPSERRMDYIYALNDAIRTRVKSGEIA